MYGKSGLAFRTFYGGVTYIRFFMETWIWLVGMLLWTGTLTRHEGLIAAFDSFVYFLNYYTIGKFAFFILGWTLSLILDPALNMEEFGLYNYFNDQNSIGDLMPVDGYRSDDVADWGFILDWNTTAATLTSIMFAFPAWRFAYQEIKATEPIEESDDDVDSRNTDNQDDLDDSFDEQESSESEDVTQNV